jgi:hypothetical protein
MRFNHTRGASMRRDADTSPASLRDVCRNHCGGRRVKMTRLVTGALRRPLRGNKTRNGASSQEAARRLAGSRPPAGPPTEPVRPEMAGEAPQGTASTTRATKPAQKSRDFDKSEQDFSEKKNPPKPHASP